MSVRALAVFPMLPEFHFHAPPDADGFICGSAKHGAGWLSCVQTGTERANWRGPAIALRVAGSAAGASFGLRATSNGHLRSVKRDIRAMCEPSSSARARVPVR